MTRIPGLTRAAVALLALAAVVTVAACATPQPTPTPTRPAATAAKPGAQGPATMKQYPAPPEMTLDQKKTYTATIVTTKGNMTAELFVKDAPNTANNFVFLARDGYYTNIKFHRIIAGFMVQTGDPTGTGAGGPGYRFKDEPVTRKYLKGTLAMANAGPNTNGSQFFIMHADYPLQPNYTIFGQVTKGLEVLDAIATVPVRVSPSGERSVPTEDVFINSISIEEK